METRIRTEIERFIRESPGNRFQESDEPYFDAPLIAFTAADDPLFREYKQVIGDFHLTPNELFAGAFGEGVRAATVIVWVLPVTRATRESNRGETVYPSRPWAQTRNFGEQLNGALRKHLVALLEGCGQRAVAPQFSPLWKEFADTPAGIASTWSERHAAYAAGLGTFSLNDALITPKGIAHRLGSVITDLSLPPSARPYPGLRSNCLYFRNGSCGLCIKRCPVDALSFAGHDKFRCRDHVYGTIPREVAERYGVTATGCGLCQTRVPCEQCIPP